MPVNPSIIRSYLRHLSQFPDPITRAYLLNLLHQRCRRPHGSDPERVKKRVEKTQHFIESVRLRIAAANSGHVNVFDSLLKEAFARTGERREEFMQPYLETAPSNQLDLPYPSSEFPTYSPALTAMLTSSHAYPSRGRPSIEDLQSISPGTLISNTWSDLPPDLQPVAPPKSPHMGMLHEARQINKRRWLRDRWLAGLTGPPLSVPPELEKNLPLKHVERSHMMLSELKKKADDLGPSGSPRYSPIQKPQLLLEDSSKRRPTLRIPAYLPKSHPLNPKPIQADCDPLSDMLPKRQRPPMPPPPLDLSRGPRKVNRRFVRRRYQAILGQVPVLEFDDPKKTNPKNKQPNLIRDSSDGKYVDRSWITPSSDQSGDHRSYCVKKAGDGLSCTRIAQMDGEDLNWMP